MANVASLSICFMSATYCAQKDIQYFEKIYHLHLTSVVGSISLLAALLFSLYYGSHHYNMGIDLDRLVLQNHCTVKYIWECYFPQGHIDRFDFPSFQTVQHLVKSSPVNSCLWLIAIALQLVQYLCQLHCEYCLHL